MFGSGPDESPSLELVVLPGVVTAPDTRPIRRFHPSWLYCRVYNASDESLFVCGPRHPSDETTLPTSLFILPAGVYTPTRWDCKGILVPHDRSVTQSSLVITGPDALKYRDMRRIRVSMSNGQYQCPASNGVLTPGQIDFAVPSATYQELLNLLRRKVAFWL